MSTPTITPVPHHLVATWPIGTFVENIAPLRGGDFAVSLHNKGEVHRVSPDGTTRLLATLPQPPAGLAVLGGVLHIVAGQPGHGPHHVHAVAHDGAVRPIMEVPESLFLNGFTPASATRAYAADSTLGAIFEIDIAAGSARIVLRHELLGKISADPMRPGANGLKLGDGVLWITNTDREILLRVPLGADGLQAEGLAIAADTLRGDDLALDEAGTLYITNHTLNTVTRLAADGARALIAGPEQGMAGATACAFGTTVQDRTCLYVTTTGGIIQPLDDVVREAKLVRLDVGVTGRPLDAWAGA